jgi:hypothetical protein
MTEELEMPFTKLISEMKASDVWHRTACAKGNVIALSFVRNSNVTMLFRVCTGSLLALIQTRIIFRF